VPGIKSISPGIAPSGSRQIALTVNGSNFIAGSVVRWDGSGRTTTFVGSTQLIASIPATDLATAGTRSITVFNPAPGGGTSGISTFTIVSVSPLTVITTRLPDAQSGKAYRYALRASGGISPYTWTVVSGGLPSGLNLASDGLISGTLPVISGNTTASLGVQVSDYAAQPNLLTQPLSIFLRTTNPGRNDNCSTATAISNGTIRASISPYGDVDVYSFQGTAGRSVTIQIYAQRLTIYGDPTSRDVFLDSFLELLDSGCNRLTYNDDIVSSTIVDSIISSYTLPSTGTYYIRVSDLRGDGRPDFIYDLELSGAN
jgi:hypothetical protein